MLHGATIESIDASILTTSDGKSLVNPFYVSDMAGSGDDMRVDEILKKLASALIERQISVAGLFSKLDTDDDGRINGPELHKGIKNLVGDFLSPGQISKVIQSLDSNADNRVDMYELRVALERVK